MHVSELINISDACKILCNENNDCSIFGVPLLQSEMERLKWNYSDNKNRINQ